MTVALADAPASRWERWAAICVALASAVVLALVLPIVDQQWAAAPAFIPAYQSAAAVNELVTAVLLFGLFQELRRPSLLVLAGGYLFTALLVVAHAISFPGLFGPAGLIGGPQTTVWLWLAWHVPLPLLVAVYAMTARGPRDGPAEGAVAPGLAVTLALLLAGAAVLLATAGHDALPVLLDGNRYIPGVTRPVLALPLALSLFALVVLALRTRLKRSLDLWLGVAMAAWAVEILLSAVLNSGRFQAGFYVGRLYGLLASCTVLVSLLLAAAALHGRLARAIAADRDAARAELEESEERLRLAGEAARVGAWELDLRTGARRWSGTTYGLFGVAPGTEITRDLVFGLIHPDDRARVAAAASRRSHPAEPLPEEEYRIRRMSDGAERVLLSRFEVLDDPATGRPARQLGVVLDVTEDRAARAALAERERLLAMIAGGRPLEACLTEVTAAVARLLPGARACILVPNASGAAFERTFSANVPASFRERIHGAEVGELAIGSCGVVVWSGQPVSCPDISGEGPWAPEWRSLCLAHGFRAVHSEPVIASDGRTLASLALYFGEPRALGAAEREAAVFGARIAAVALERDRAAAALRESEQLRRLAIEGAQVGVWELDLASGRGRWSAEAVALFGIDRDSFGAEDWTDAVFPADRARAAAAWRRAVEDGAPYEAQFRAAAPAPGGAPRWLLSRGHVERDDAGRPLRGAGVLLDVTDRVKAEAEMRAALTELRSVYDTAPVGLCVLDLEGRFVRINERLAAINGLPPEAHIGRTVRELLPSVAEAAERLHRIVIETGEPVLNVEIVGETPARPGVQRVREEHWYPLRDAEDRIVGINVVAEEVTERKEAEERQRLLTREVDHRAKNALTMVQSVVRLTRAEDPRSFVRAVEGRIAALARAQGLLAEVRWSGVELRALLLAELAAFLPAEGAVSDAPGLHLDGPSVILAPNAAQPVAMIAHEMATNATKYGALSVRSGRILLSWQVDGAAGMLRLRWAETGGPPVEGEPARRGFGSRVVETLVGTQLGGRVTRRWSPAGLVCEMAFALSRTVISSGNAEALAGAAPGAAINR